MFLVEDETVFLSTIRISLFRENTNAKLENELLSVYPAAPGTTAPFHTVEYFMFYKRLRL